MRINMRVERLRNGYTIKQLGQIIKVHPNAISRWESGETTPSTNNLIELCNLYECTPEYLLDMSDDKHASAIAP